MKISDKNRLFELFAIVLTAIGKFVFMDWLDYRLPFVVTTIIFWTSYVLFKTRKDKEALTNWGFRKDNLVITLKLVLPFTLISIVSCLIIGYYNDSIIYTWHIFPILITYLYGELYNNF